MRLARHNSVFLPVFVLVLGSALALAPALHAAIESAPVSPHNPYDIQLAGLVAALQNAPAPQAAVLLKRIYELRDFLDNPDAVVLPLSEVALDGKRHPLVRDEALHWLALLDVHENRLDAARAAFVQLGFVRQWAIVGPFTARPGLDGELGPEQGFRAGREYADGAALRRWRVVPDFGPHGAVDLSDFYPQAAPAVVYASTSIFTEAPRILALRIGADSALAVFVNGKQVLRDDAENPRGFDQHPVGVELHKGWNAVVLKLYRRDQGPWSFALRLTGLNGGGLQLNTSATEPLEPAVEVTWPVAIPVDLVAVAQQIAQSTP